MTDPPFSSPLLHRSRSQGISRQPIDTTFIYLSPLPPPPPLISVISHSLHPTFISPLPFISLPTPPLITLKTVTTNEGGFEDSFSPTLPTQFERSKSTGHHVKTIRSTLNLKQMNLGKSMLPNQGTTMSAGHLILPGGLGPYKTLLTLP